MTETFTTGVCNTNQDAVGRPRESWGSTCNMTIIRMERAEMRQGPRAGEGNMSFTEDSALDGEINSKGGRPRKQDALKGRTSVQFFLLSPSSLSFLLSF